MYVAVGGSIACVAVNCLGCIMKELNFDQQAMKLGYLFVCGAALYLVISFVLSSRVHQHGKGA